MAGHLNAMRWHNCPPQKRLKSDAPRAMPRKILVTHALPYANGRLHVGHMVGYIQTDICVRFQRMRGNDVVFVAGEDAHGTPIMLAAEKAGIAPEKFVADVKTQRSEERRVGKECRSRWSPYH